MWPLDGKSVVKRGLVLPSVLLPGSVTDQLLTGISPRCYGDAFYVTAVLEWANHTSAYWHLNRVSSLDPNSNPRKRRDSHLCGVQPHFLDEGELYTTNCDELISADESFTQIERLCSEVLK